MKILIPFDKDFDFSACKNLYLKYEKFMGNNCNFEDLISNSHFYSFYKNDMLTGCIYVVKEDGNLYLNGFSIPKNHLFNIDAILKVCGFYNCTIFSKTKNKTAEILLRRCGFKEFKTDKNGFKYFKKEK